jgi:hypothetical protein
VSNGTAYDDGVRDTRLDGLEAGQGRIEAALERIEARLRSQEIKGGMIAGAVSVITTGITLWLRGGKP